MRNIDHGTAAISLLVLAAVLAVVLSVGIPIVLAAEPIKVSDWLGFAGAIAAFAGAILVAKIAVAPVWRQVNIMASQAALELYPILEADLTEVDRDKVFLNSIWKIGDGLKKVTARVDFADQSDRLLAEAIANELINLRGMIDRIAEEEWQRFYGRLRLEEGLREQRKELRRHLARIKEKSLELTRRQSTPQGVDRTKFMETITSTFITDVNRFFEAAAGNLAVDLTLQTVSLSKERDRLIRRGAELREAMEIV